MQLGFTVWCNSSSTSAVSGEQLRRCGLCGFMGRRWRARVSRGRMHRRKWTNRSLRGVAAVGMVQYHLHHHRAVLLCLAMLCLYNEAIQQKRTSQAGLHVINLQDFAGINTQRQEVLCVLDQDRNPAKALLLLKYSWQLPAREVGFHNQKSTACINHSIVCGQNNFCHQILYSQKSASLTFFMMSSTHLAKFMVHIYLAIHLVQARAPELLRWPWSMEGTCLFPLSLA